MRQESAVPRDDGFEQLGDDDRRARADRVERCPRMHSLAQRLIHEATLSLEVASMLEPQLTQDVIIHLDVNQDEKHRSAQYARSLAGMGLGSGFQVRLKPEAWCASHVADHVVKEKHLRVA